MSLGIHFVSRCHWLRSGDQDMLIASLSLLGGIRILSWLIQEISTCFCCLNDIMTSCWLAGSGLVIVVFRRSGPVIDLSRTLPPDSQTPSLSPAVLFN